MQSLLLLICWLLSIVVSSHSDRLAPKVMGGSQLLAKLKSRNVFTPDQQVDVETVAKRVAAPKSHVQRKKAAQCGPGVGNCPTGLCCSIDGSCGTGVDWCAAPDCQFLYSAACDANQIPSGASTSGIARTQVGSVPYGLRINSCTKPNVIALTYDDGPYLYTSALLDLLDTYNAKVTFFITGNNLGKGEIDGCGSPYPDIIQRMVASGHQVASHSWSHQDLMTLDTTHFYDQIYYNEMAFRNILGYIPTYFRPPYVDCDSGCHAKLGALGYHSIYYDLDTFDYENDDPTLIQTSKDNFANYFDPTPHPVNGLTLDHDTHYQTVYNLTAFMLQNMAAEGYGTSVTVGTCLGDPPANWYRSATGSTGCTPQAVISGLTVSTEGNCTGTLTCQDSAFGNCCSRYNFCGSTPDYCDPAQGCQASYGLCGVNTTSAAASSSSTLSSSSSTKKPTTTTSSSSSSSSSTTGSTTSSTSSSNSQAASSSSATTKTSTSTSSSSSTLSSSSPTKNPTTTTSSSSSSSTLSSSSSTKNPTTTTSSSSSSSTLSSSSSTKTPTTTTSSSSSSNSQAGSSSSSATSTTATTKTSTSTSSSTSATSTSTLKISTDGACGGTTGETCQGSTFGNCCSRYGHCGSTAAYCGAYCQPAFGTCSAPASTTASLIVSLEGSCGSGITCLNSAFGNCCSQYNFCGNTTAFCGTGCNKAFGTCN